MGDVRDEALAGSQVLDADDVAINDDTVEASRWARSVGIRTPCSVTKEALARIGGFGESLEALTTEQVAAVAMAILRSLKLVAFADADSPMVFPVTFVHRGMGMTNSLQLTATLEPAGSEYRLVVSRARGVVDCD